MSCYSMVCRRFAQRSPTLKRRRGLVTLCVSCLLLSSTGARASGPHIAPFWNIKWLIYRKGIGFRIRTTTKSTSSALYTCEESGSRVYLKGYQARNPELAGYNNSNNRVLMTRGNAPGVNNLWVVSDPGQRGTIIALYTLGSPMKNSSGTEYISAQDQFSVVTGTA